MHRPSLRAAVLALGAAAMMNAVVTPAEALTYDGTDPAAGCSSTAITARQAGLNNSMGNFGLIDLRYSTGCRTAWARLTSTYGVACTPGDDGCGSAYVHRNSTTYPAHYSCPTPAGGKSCYTKQVNDAGFTSYAHGEVDTGPLTASGTTSSY
ncbi:MAG TPA: DUF2690 domain-containing protein [Mycobacteriales bacterium]|jgi:hypothetical protein